MERKLLYIPVYISIYFVAKIINIQVLYDHMYRSEQNHIITSHVSCKTGTYVITHSCKYASGQISNYTDQVMF